MKRHPVSSGKAVKQGDFFRFGREKAEKKAKEQQKRRETGAVGKCLRKIHCYLVPEVVE